MAIQKASAAGSLVQRLQRIVEQGDSQQTRDRGAVGAKDSVIAAVRPELAGSEEALSAAERLGEQLLSSPDAALGAFGNLDAAAVRALLED